MIQYYLDPDTHLVYADTPTRRDRIFRRMAEQHFLRNYQYNKTSPVWWVKTGIDYLMAITARIRLARHLEVVPNRIVFGAFQEDYTCNCKAIAEEILSQGADYEIVFLVNEEVYRNREDTSFPENIYLVKKHSLESFYILATSRFWIDNALVCCWKYLPKKSSQTYFNTWHGSLGIKRLSGNAHWKLIAHLSDRQIDYFLTNSRFDEQVFTNAFWPHVKHLKIGHPRNDLFFHPEKTAALCQKIRDTYRISEETKLCLYAPTFRDKKEEEAALPDFQMIKESLEKRFGGNWIIMVRLHFKDRNSDSARKAAETCNYVVDSSSYPDIQELLAAADAGITDYSSWIFDYLFTGKPAFIYASDIKKYMHDRGFYYPLTETPFSIADSTPSLAEAICRFDEEAYHKKVQAFLESKGCYEKGDACRKLLQFLESLSRK